MNVTTYLNMVRDLFFIRLDRKTGWGKEELKKVFNECIEAVLIRMIEDSQRKDK